MNFLSSCWDTLLQITFYGQQHLGIGYGLGQQPLALPGHGNDLAAAPQTGVSFQVPGTNFTCSYPSMTGFQACNTANDRSCWLEGPVGRSGYNISTDYENNSPSGVPREYWLEVGIDAIAPDGYVKPLGQVFNNSYPGPNLEACWGDEMIVHVTNKIPDLGTTIHWHGIRQLGTNQQDGVNGITQCPIAFNETYTYRFNVTQYGHTWYHAHYQTQYSDGVMAPLTIYGPTSAEWDETFEPILVSDWLHGNSSDAFKEELAGGIPLSDSLVIGGTGNFKCSDQDPLCCSSCGRGGCNTEGGENPEFCCTPNEACVKDGVTQAGGFFTKTFQEGKRYLLKLVNSSAEAMFIFSIDEHELLVIATDLVPIEPYKTDSIFIGIGQRYQIVVTAKPKKKSAACKSNSEDCNYWIRTRIATGCGNVAQDTETVGIVNYNASTPTGTQPTTLPNSDRSACIDEPVASLQPVFHWNVDKLVNNRNNFTFDADISSVATHGAFRWDLLETPLFLDYGNPAILNIDNETYFQNPFTAAVNYTDPAWDDQFVYMVITGGQAGALKRPVPAAHPIHMHGHDFVILTQEDAPFNGSNIPPPQTKNPPRRDVALLYPGGYLALAFKLDNPGLWLVHCHIAWHASSGLALQIVERQHEIIPSIGGVGALAATEQTCKGWAEMDLKFNQDDSGI